MARNEQGEGIGSNGVGYGTHRFGAAYLLSDRCIGTALAVWNLSQNLPYLLLESGTYGS